MSLRFVLVLIAALGAAAFAAPHHAQAQQAATPQAGEIDRSATGGAQTLEDILARQRGERIDDSFRRNAIGSRNGAPMTDQLGTLGGASDPELWRALRYGEADVTASNASPGANLLVQDGGMRWLTFRAGPLRVWGGYLLLGTLAALALFYLLRGKIRIESGRSDITIERFKPIERFGHWLLAGSFILLGLTGLVSLFGRVALIPLVGHDAFAPLAQASKWIHNNVAWAFIVGLVLVFVMWVAHNIPSRLDLVWLAKGGGLFSKNSHPEARKFNAGQKIIFWSVIVLGGSLSLSGLSLLFPFQMPLFAPTFAMLNDLGVTGLAGQGALPTVLAPHEEMQLAQLWHAIVAFLMMAVILAHIYLGSVGMEGAYAAMGDGHVDINWAREHHGLWVDEVEAAAKTGTAAAPGE